MNKAYYVDKWEDEEAFRLFQLHVGRVKNAKPTISKDYYKTVPFPQNSDRLSKLGERHRVAMENKALGNRLCSIKMNKGEFGKLLEETRQKKKSRHKSRLQVKKELEQKLLHEENLKLLQRLIEAKPFCRRSVWKKDRERIDHFLKVRQKQRVIPLRFRSKGQRQKALDMAIKKSTKRRAQLAKREEERKRKLSENVPLTPPLFEDYIGKQEKTAAKPKKQKERRSIQQKVNSLDKTFQKELKIKRQARAPHPPQTRSKSKSESPRSRRVVGKRKAKPKRFHYTRLPKEYFTTTNHSPNDEEIRKQLQQKPTYSEQQNTAARLIQKTIRTRLCRDAKPAPLRERVAARKIQSNMRQNLCRKREVKHRAAKTIQSSLRSRLQRKNVAANKIQRTMRTGMTEKKATKDRAARQIQRGLKASLCRKRSSLADETEKKLEDGKESSEKPKDSVKGTTLLTGQEASEATVPSKTETSSTTKVEASQNDAVVTTNDDLTVVDSTQDPDLTEEVTEEVTESATGAAAILHTDTVPETGSVSASGPTEAAEEIALVEEAEQPAAQVDMEQKEEELATESTIVDVNDENDLRNIVRTLSREWTDNVLRSSLAAMAREDPILIRTFAEDWWKALLAQLDS